MATSLHGFRLYFVNNSLHCGFRKYENNPLLIICLVDENVQYLRKIEEEEKIISSNIKYNFKIQPVTNNEIIKVKTSSLGSEISLLYPEILNFTNVDTL